MDTRQKMNEFFEELDYLDRRAIASLIGMNHYYFLNWLKSSNNNRFADSICERFLQKDGRELKMIHLAFRNGSKNRIRLHEKRSRILQKARVHQTTNQHVPSYSFN